MTCQQGSQTTSARLNPNLKAVAEKLLPRFLLDYLDPVQSLIESEVSRIAAQTPDDHVVLDAGAGEGRHRKLFAKGTYLALDLAVGDPSWDYTNLDVRGRLESIPLLPASVDAILCMVVLEHTRNPRQVLEEFCRVLKVGGKCILVIPFLWEEHQAPHDYFRFTRYGTRVLFEGLPLKIDALQPIGGFFRLCARRCINLLAFFQRGWRWPLFFILAPFFGFLFPLLLHSLDWLDSSKNFTLGFLVRATKEDA